MNYISQIRIFNINILKSVIENTKKQASDIVVIPRLMNKAYDQFETAGINAGSIVVTSEYDGTNPAVPLWDDESLHYIAFYFKDIAPFMRLAGNDNEDNFMIETHQYIINGFPVSIAIAISSRTPHKATVEEDGKEITKDIYPSLMCIPYQEPLASIRSILYQFEHSRLIMSDVVNYGFDMREDSEFIDVWEQGSATDGAVAWTPNINKYPAELRTYIIYVAKTAFTFSKNDQVFLQIRDNVIGEPNYIFLARFTVIRKKKGVRSIHNYYLRCYRMEYGR